MTLKDLPIGKTATIKSVGGEGALRQHFLDMGLIPKGEVTMVKYAPMGDPMELRIHSYELTLRLADAEKIEIEDIRDADQIAAEKNKKQRESSILFVTHSIDEAPAWARAVNTTSKRPSTRCRRTRR